MDTKTRPVRTDKITSTFALLDVKGQRHALMDHFADIPRIGPCPPEKRIPVVIHGYLDGRWSDDDGTSVEFSVDVQKLEFPK